MGGKELTQPRTPHLLAVGACGGMRRDRVAAAVVAVDHRLVGNVVERAILGRSAHRDRPRGRDRRPMRQRGRGEQWGRDAHTGVGWDESHRQLRRRRRVVGPKESRGGRDHALERAVAPNLRRIGAVAPNLRPVGGCVLAVGLLPGKLR